MPLLGAYDSRSTAVLEQHARWIAESGVGVVNLSWWGPGSFSDRAVSRVMDVMGAHDIRVGFHLEPYGPTRVARLSSDVQFLLREYGEKRRWDCFFLHQRADGTRGPVFKLFATTLPQRLEDCHGVLQEVPGFTPDGVWRRATDEVHTMLDGVFPHVTPAFRYLGCRSSESGRAQRDCDLWSRCRAGGVAGPRVDCQSTGSTLFVQREPGSG